MINQVGKNTKIVQKDSDAIVISLNQFCKPIPDTYDCLLILNLQQSQDVLKMVIEGASNVIIADGGANFLYKSSFKDCPKIKAIAGDFDSIEPEVEKYYKEKKVMMCRDENEDMCDFEKCLLIAKNLGLRSVVCLGAMGGRLDHSLGSMHIATRFGRNSPQMQIFLLGDNNFMFYFQPNQKYVVHVCQLFQKKGCGLIPFCKVHHLQTTGFKWNLGKESHFSSLEWGSFISTSNEIVGDSFTVLASDQVFFVCSFKK